MRDFKGMKRQRGRNRKAGGGGGANSANPNRSWDSQGPENIKVRGNAQTVYERYMQLARDASSAGDRVLAENYLQHAEHYFRVLRALQPQRPASEIAQREMAGQGFDIDFEDESGAQAAAFLAAQQAADRAAEEERRREQQRSEQRQDRDRPERQDRERQDRGERDGEDGEARAEGEGGGRRETRRERWERRQQERQRRFAEERGESVAAEAPSDAGEDRPTEPAPVAGTVPDDEAETGALPGFLTRRTPSRAAVETASGSDEVAAQAPAPKKRAPRRKAEVASDQ
ncbi:DUF4167 domain-containing protein [Brevundimonas fluminis]|jgi:hypothetical protein|uniref:DUF4167 domain-containing protein n=1 Tax=Brevundimonas fluminis TaxID=2487274 RepID=UPI000F658284|nr:DUF4167 domain-containing protein [Brevundimonas fluminis]